MTDSCFIAQTVTEKSIANEIKLLTFQCNDSGHYTHLAITQLVKGIQQVLKQQYNPEGGSKGILTSSIKTKKDRKQTKL